MTTSPEKQVEAGTRWADRDWRERGPQGDPRIVEVLPPDASVIGDTVRVKVVEAPNKPYTVGRVNYLSSTTLRRRYREVPDA